MTTQNNIQRQDVRLAMKPLMQNIQILDQSGDISVEQKNQMCVSLKQALIDGNLQNLQKTFKALRYGTSFPEIIEECIQLTN